MLKDNYIICITIVHNLYYLVKLTILLYIIGLSLQRNFLSPHPVKVRFKRIT